jgi:Flp pilus assembly secretin CpaC
MTRKMAPNQVPLKSVIGRASNMIVLAVIFALTACLSMSLHLGFGKSTRAEVTSAELEQVRREAQAAIPRLPADTEDRLAAALYPQLAPIANISDPFVDRAGVASSNGAGNVSALMARTRGTTINNQTVSAIPATPAVPTLLSRLQSWQHSVKAALNTGQFPPPITTAYLQTEIAPTGRIDTGGRRGAWFYIASEKRTLAATVGAKFYDAMLMSIGSEGVVFRLQDGTTKRIEWDRDEDFATTTATAAKSNEQQAQPTQSPAVKTIGEEQNSNGQQNSTSGTSGPRTSRQPDRPSIQTGGGEFELLQDAVRGRYSKRKLVSETARTEPLRVRPAVERAHARVEFLQPVYAEGEPRTIAAFTKASYRDETSVSPLTTQPLLELPENVSTANVKDDDYELNAPTSSPSPSPTPSPARETIVAPIPEPSTATLARTTPPTEPNDKTRPQPARGSLCDPQFRGDNITITNESNRPITLLSFVNKLNEAYGANIVLDYDVQDVPVRVNITDAPWTSVLRTLLDLNDLDLVCLDGRIVQIAKRSKIAQMEDGRRKMAPLVREVFKLRYLQPTAGGRVNLAGVTQASAGATIQSIEEAIRAILKAGGDTRGEARRVPGRNEIFVAATREQMAEIRDLIARVDRPGYQVLIKALVYTANENRLRDIGSQVSLIVGNGGQTNLGGFTTLPRSNQNNNGSGNGNGTANNNNTFGLNPGGVPSLGDGFRQPTGSLGGASPVGTFGVSGVFGTAQVAYQLTLAQQRGVINIQSRPFGIVSDGDTFDLVAGTQIPVVTTTIAGGAPFQSGNVQFIEASRIARITPQVAETEDGKPGFVTLQIQLENNSVDTSLGTFNGVPGVNRQSLQTVMRLHNGETAIVGGLAADTVSNATSKVPGIGDIPVVGNLFKRKTNQENRDRLYFAITVEVISQESPLINVPAPSDAMTTPPPPPRAQRPSPFQKR